MVVILRTCNKGALSIIWPGVSYDLVGIFSIDNGDGSECVTFKMNLRFFNLCRVFQFILVPRVLSYPSLPSEGEPGNEVDSNPLKNVKCWRISRS